MQDRLQDFQRKIIKMWGNLSIFAEISLAEVLQTVKYGLRIAKEVKTRIPREFEEYRYILGDLGNVKAEGSLYKCFKCGKGELSDDEVESIKEITRHDAAAGVCGTPAETIVYFVSGAKEYILSSISGVGPTVAGNLLRHFGSVEKVITAPQEELMKVERVGARIAGRIREVAEGKYDQSHPDQDLFPA